MTIMKWNIYASSELIGKKVPCTRAIFRQTKCGQKIFSQEKSAGPKSNLWLAVLLPKIVCVPGKNKCSRLSGISLIHVKSCTLYDIHHSPSSSKFIPIFSCSSFDINIHSSLPSALYNFIYKYIGIYNIWSLYLNIPSSFPLCCSTPGIPDSNKRYHTFHSWSFYVCLYNLVKQIKD